MNFILSVLIFSLGTLSSWGLPTLSQIIDTQEAPQLIIPTGKRESLEPMVDGQIHGRARYYHPNGQLYGVIEWDHGNKVGSHTLYREDGTPEQYLSYKNIMLIPLVLNPMFARVESTISKAVKDFSD